MTSPDDNIPPCTIVSQNARGTKSGNRLDHCIASMSSRGADVVLLQEHGLHVEDKSRLTRICRRYGYLAFAAFIPRTKTHGGTAVLIKWQTTVWSKYGTFVVTFRAGLSGSCVLPCRPLPPSRVPCLRPVFFNTATCWPRVLRSVSPRGPGCLAANMGAGRVCAVSESQAARGSPQSSPGR